MSMLGHATHHDSLTLPGMARMLVHNGAANPTGTRETTKDQLPRLGSPLWLKANASNAAWTEICESSSSPVSGLSVCVLVKKMAPLCREA